MMVRATFHVLAAVSMLLCVGTAALWVDSYRAENYATYDVLWDAQRPQVYCWVIVQSSEGKAVLGLAVRRNDPDFSAPPSGFHAGRSAARKLRLAAPPADWPWHVRQVAGYGVEWGDTMLGIERAYHLLLPWWLLWLSTVILPARWYMLWRG